MRLNKLFVTDFRNYRETDIQFRGNIVGFLGKNGAGKTNLLDAIHYLSFTKSAIVPGDSANIREGENQLSIRGDFEINGREHQVICSYRSGSRKSVKVDGKDVSRLADHIGNFPVVMIAPNDIELIWDGSELRRRFFDSLISQLDRNYLDNLIKYNHHLRQRNSLLKAAADSRLDVDLLDSYDQQLIECGNYIFERRKGFIEGFIEQLAANYSVMSDGTDNKVGIGYKSDLTDRDFKTLLKENLGKDQALQRTTTGVHRDDFVFLLSENELRRYGSQGQQKSFLIALKLAEFQCLETAKQLKPLLLLDDIFDKLDDERIHKLITLVSKNRFGQLFITDARPSRTMNLLEKADIDAELFRIENGNLSRWP